MKISSFLALGIISSIHTLPYNEQQESLQAKLKANAATIQASHLIQLSPTRTEWVTEEGLRDLKKVSEYFVL
jgi:hypothetical protein